MSKIRAKKYARALFDSYELSEVEFVRKSINILSEVWEGNSDLRSFFLNPAQVNKKEIVLELSGFFSEEKFSNFLNLLLDKNIFNLLPDIKDSFNDIYESYKESVKLSLISATNIDENEREDLLASLKKDFGDQLEIEWKENSELLGGFTVRSGDALLDSSIKGALNKIKNSLIL